MVNHEKNQNQNHHHQQQQTEMEEKEKQNPNPEPEKKTNEEKKEKKEDTEANKEAPPPPPPPPPPQEVVLKVFMHCEGCAKKVKRSLKGFPGVEDVIADSKTHKVVVKGEKAAAEPVKVMERVQMKTHRRVELISPIPAAKPEKADAPEEPKPAEPEDKKKEEEEGPKVITAVLKVHMHCDACSLAIKKRILRMKGVESVETDLKNSQVTVVGVLDPAKLVDYLYKRTGKHAAIVKQEPLPDKKEEEAKKEETKEDEKKQKTDDKPAEAGAKGGGEGAEKKEDDEKAKENSVIDEDEKAKLIGIKQNEFYYYPAFYAPKFAMDQYYTAALVHPPPPQMFSDENPNACSVM